MKGLKHRENGLTVAIPTKDSWRGFLRGQLPVYLNHPAVSYVIICDETGNDIIDICQEGYDRHPKLRIYPNDTVLGAYENKRQCFMKAPTKWVAILDSNNLFGPDFFDALLSCMLRRGEQTKTMYYAGRAERFLPLTASTENRTGHFNGMKITKDNWNMVLDMREWNILLNSGNVIWPTKIIKHFPELPDGTEGMDNMFLMRMAINAGYTMSIEPTMYYIYTVIEDSKEPQLEVKDWVF